MPILPFVAPVVMPVSVSSVSVLNSIPILTSVAPIPLSVIGTPSSDVAAVVDVMGLAPFGSLGIATVLAASDEAVDSGSAAVSAALGVVDGTKPGAEVTTLDIPKIPEDATVAALSRGKGQCPVCMHLIRHDLRTHATRCLAKTKGSDATDVIDCSR